MSRGALKPAWGAGEIARSALSELTDGERIDLIVEIAQQIRDAKLVAGVVDAMSVHLGDLVADRHADDLVAGGMGKPAGWDVSERLLSDLFELDEAARIRLIVAVLLYIGDLKLIAEARNALTDHLGDCIARQYGLYRDEAPA